MLKCLQYNSIYSIWRKHFPIITEQQLSIYLSLNGAVLQVPSYHMPDNGARKLWGNDS